MEYEIGDWIKIEYRWGGEDILKVIDIRPDDVLVCGEHDRDTEPRNVRPKNVHEKL